MKVQHFSDSIEPYSDFEPQQRAIQFPGLQFRMLEMLIKL